MKFVSQNTNIFLETKPCQWPVRDETNMRGAKWLGHGSYGCAGLWCRVDPTNVIQRVSYRVSYRGIVNTC